MADEVIICRTCAEGAEGFAEALQARVAAEVRLVDCLNVCDAPVAMALKGAKKDAYLFAGVDTARDLDDAVALVGLFANAAPSIEDARPAGRLRHCLKGRIPA